jgi:uncharacterized protein YjiS (DUF1127 family)
MSESLLVAPSIPFASAAPRDQGVVARTVKALSAPARWFRNREVQAQLAGLSEREWHDIGAGPRDAGCGYPVLEDEAERRARRIALAAWGVSRRPVRPATARAA